MTAKLIHNPIIFHVYEEKKTTKKNHKLSVKCISETGVHMLTILHHTFLNRQAGLSSLKKKKQKTLRINGNYKYIYMLMFCALNKCSLTNELKPNCFLFSYSIYYDDNKLALILRIIYTMQLNQFQLSFNCDD